MGGLIGSTLERLSDGQRAILCELARHDSTGSVRNLAGVLRRPLTEVVDDLGVLVGNGLVLAPHSEPATDLRIPNLLRALLLRPQR